MFGNLFNCFDLTDVSRNTSIFNNLFYLYCTVYLYLSKFLVTYSENQNTFFRILKTDYQNDLELLDYYYKTIITVVQYHERFQWEK